MSHTPARPFVIACIGVAAVLGTGPAARAEPSRDLLVNGGFEEAQTGWSYTGDWIADPSVARTGAGCVRGRVDEPNRSKKLEQIVTLRSGAVYDLSFWARAEHGVKAAAWIHRPGERLKLAMFLTIPSDWTRHDVSFTVPESAEWTLELVVPSSYNATPGRMWVDDVSLTHRSVLGEVARFAEGGIHDFPALAADDAGTLYAAWIETAQGVDRLRYAVSTPDGDSLVSGPSRSARVEATAIESVTLAGADDGAWGCAAIENAGWDLWCFRLDASGGLVGSWVQRDATTDIHPAIVRSGDEVWVAWESNRDDHRQIWATRLPPLSAEAMVRLSDGSDSSYHPSLAGDGNGRLWAAWQQFVDGQYDIFLADYDGTRWGPARRLTDNPYLEARPDLAWTGDALWAAWEVSRFNSYRTSYAAFRRVVTSRITGRDLAAPAGFWDAAPDWSSNPRLLAGSDGRLYLSVRRSRGRSSNWEGQLLVFEAGRWRERHTLTLDSGRNRPIPLAEAAGRVWAVVQRDNIKGSWNSVEASGGIESQLPVTALPIVEEGAVEPLRMQPVEWPPTDFRPEWMRERKGEDRPRFSIEHAGRSLELYFGQLHEHSEISLCNRRADLSPDDNYMLNRDIHRLDFSALTDHDFNTSAHIWSWLGKLARWQHDPGHHVTFLAQEWTSSFEDSTPQHPEGFYGHRNLILGDPHYPRWFNAREGMTPADVWHDLRQDGVDFIHVPHQLADTGNVPTDWDFVDEVAQPVAEIFQHRGSYERAGAPRGANRTVDGHFLTDAWDDGVIIGTIASPDHGGGRGKAAVFATELTREALLEAFRARRTYGTTGAKILLDFRVEGKLMGAKLPLRSGPVHIDLFVDGTLPLVYVDVLKNGEVIRRFDVGQRTFRVSWTDEASPEDGTYYYVRVRQSDTEMAWSSPVWFLSDTEAIQVRGGVPDRPARGVEVEVPTPVYEHDGHTHDGHTHDGQRDH